MTKWEWAGAHALSGGIIAGTASALAATGPLGLIVVGGTGVVVSGADFVNTVHIIKTETGLTACTVTRLLLDVTSGVLSVIGIKEGIRAWRASGSAFSWAQQYSAIQPPTNRNGLRQAMGAPPPEFANPQVHHNLPWRFRAWFAGQGRGLNVNDPIYGRWVEGTPPGPHQIWSGMYELEWETFITNNPNATRPQVLAFLDRLLASGRFPSR